MNLKLAAKSYDSEINQRVVTPITTFDYENSGSITTNSLLSLDGSINIYNENPIVVAFDGVTPNDSDSSKYFETNTQIFTLTYALQSFINEKNSLSLSSNIFYETLYELITQEYSASQENNLSLDLSEELETELFIVCLLYTSDAADE